VATIPPPQPMSIVQAAADLAWSPMLRKFPDLTFALSEGGIGWVPYFLERIDRVYKMHHAWTHQDFGDKLPSEVFLDRVALCFIDDHFGVANRDKLNIDMVSWECDYPHSDSTWPLAPETLEIYLDGVPDDEVNKITHANALKLYSFDMFSHIPKEQLTVGALRAQATDVDLGFRSSERLKKSGTDTVSVLDLASRLPSSA
jgi:Amidohydrolase